MKAFFQVICLVRRDLEMLQPTGDISLCLVFPLRPADISHPCALVALSNVLQIAML